MSRTGGARRDGGPGEHGSLHSVPRPCGTPAAGLPGPLETQRYGPGQGPGSKVRFSGCPGACRVGVSPALPHPARPLTLVLLHERPHVSLLWAVCKGAVPHVLALTAVLCVDAELQGGAWGESAESCWMVSRPPASSQALLGPQGLTSEAPMPPCTPPWCSHRIAVGRRMDGSGRTDTHFLLALDITRRTRQPCPAAGHSGLCGTLQRAQLSPMALVSDHPCPCMEPGSPVPCLGAAVLGGPCRASTTCPFLQHWPHTNFICRSAKGAHGSRHPAGERGW